jgi:acetyl esterase
MQQTDAREASMTTDRLDPEMRAAQAARDTFAATLPPVTLTEPFGPSRVINERIAMLAGEGGPTMAETREHWLPLRGRRVLCRVHKPVARGDLPVLVWFHGGGWVFQSIDSHDRLVRELAAAAGVAAVSVDYSLAPESRFPQGLLECADAVRALPGADWGLDGSRIVVGGDSAGGNLALATALHLRDAGGPALRGILTAYPVTAADFDSRSYREFADGFGLTAAGMRAYWDLYTRDPADRLNPLAAPLLADCAGLPPTLIQLAELDVLRSDGEGMAAKLRAAGVDVTLETYPGMLHGFVRLTGQVAAARRAVTAAGAWLKARTG